MHVAPLAVVGLGYNSLWQRHRRNYDRWARRFDRDARHLLTTLRRRGARHIVWVTLRRPTRRTIGPAGGSDLRDYAWYFGYVNERLHRLDRRRDELTLADWAKASRRPGLTYDAIHLTPEGARLMTHTIRRAIHRDLHKRGTVRS